MTLALHLSNIWIKNRVPFGDLAIKLNQSEIALLTAINGRGKTTILAYVADAFYEMAKAHFRNIAPNEGAFYRISSGLDTFDQAKASIVYLRFITEEQVFDFVELRAPCSLEQYASATQDIPDPIDFNSRIAPILKNAGAAKVISPNWTKEIAEQVFNQNVLTYFPAYRFEIPEYLNEPFQKKLNYQKSMRFDGILEKPIEAASTFSHIANWLMDVVLDCRAGGADARVQQIFTNINTILTLALSAKHEKPLRFGIGPRNFGPTRIQVLTRTDPPVQIYPTIFRLSSGEQALLTLFAEVLRQADFTQPDIALHDISGIVLIDEVDKHLHIKLQKEVLPLLFSLFPRVQFVASSHSPFLGMGIASVAPNRGRIIDVVSGLPLLPRNDPLYEEVYEMMLSEEAHFRALYNTIQRDVDATKKLQILTEGLNTEHILKALKVLAPELATEVHMVSGVKDRTGKQQLKNAFEIMSVAKHSGHFLFVWDCDVQSEYNSVTEANNCWKYKFTTNAANVVAVKGIENNYPPDLFTEDLYEWTTIAGDYGNEIKKKEFNKKAFLKKVEALDTPDTFANFAGLIQKMKQILA